MNSCSDNILYAYEEEIEVPIRVLKLNSKFYYINKCKASTSISGGISTQKKSRFVSIIYIYEE